MSSHHRIVPAGVPPAPPPPVLSNSHSSRSRGSRRSRSRSPPPNSRNSRYRRDDSRDRDRGRRRSPSPYRGSSGSSRQTESFRKAEALPPASHAAHTNQSSLSSHPSHNSHTSSSLQQSISLIAGEEVPPIIRRIVDPYELKMPRRADEGIRQIFDRPDVKEGILRRKRLEDSDDVQQIAPQPVIQEQRVIAIIREPIPMELLDNYRGMPGLKETGTSAFSSSRHSHLQPVSPEALRPSNEGPVGYRRSVSPHARDRARRLSQERSLERKQELYREREREVRERERELDLRERVREQQAGIRSRSPRERERVVERYHQPVNSVTAVRPRSRSRSPVPVRIRRSRSRSRTPPPMPPEIRRQMLERDRDLRNKLSRPLGKLPSSTKFDSEHDFRGAQGSSRGGRPFSRTTTRGRGGFQRGTRSRAREDSHSRTRGLWEHDMFERDDLDQVSGDSKPNK